MNHYVGIDVSLEASSVCVVDGNGKIVCEGKIASEPDALIAWLKGLKLELTRIGLEAGPLSQWLYAAMRQAGLAVELLETRHVRNALKTMPVKSDRNDARGIAQLMRLGWFRPVHCKSIPAQETRALLTARKLVQVKLHDIEMSLRGILRGFGLKVGPTTPARFEGRIRELVAGHPSLEAIAQGLLAVRVALRREFDRFEKQVHAMARRVAMSEPRSRSAARTCAGLDGVGAYRTIMICVIIRNLHSDSRDITEAYAIGQHPMHDDGNFAGQRHLGFLHSAAPGELHRPALQCRAALEWLGQYDVGGLVKNRAHRCITDLRDAAVDVRLARLVFGWRQAEIGSDLF
jgi:Transposase